jgi:hypothetical protein
MSGVDPKRFMRVVEKHASTVTLAFLCDIMPVVGLSMTVSLVDDADAPKHGEGDEG